MEQLRLLQVPFHQGSRIGEINLCCPFCSDRNETEDTRFRLGVNINRQLAQCFNCGWKSREALKWILRKFSGKEPSSITPATVTAPVKIPVAWPDDVEDAWKIQEGDYPAYSGVEYLLKRGISLSEMQQFDIHISLTGSLAYRILFPVMWRGKLRGLVGRDFTGLAAAKYKNSVGQKYLWHMPTIVPKKQVVVLSEGVFKAIALHKALKLISVALLGHSITEKQLGQLSHANAKSLIIWSDPDLVGIKGATEIAQVLSNLGYHVRFIWPLPKAQVDELSGAELRSMYNTCCCTWDWKLSTAIQTSLAFGGIK
jgi:hypothetical protein